MPDRTVELLHEIARLRRLARRLGDDVDLERTESLLLAVIGPTVKRSVAARTFGVTQTALDRWIASGEIATVRTQTGRPEVPVGEVIDLLEEIEETSAGARRLSEAIRRRRDRTVRTLGLDLLPWEPGDPNGHRAADLRALAYHRAVGKQLTPAKVRAARERLASWRAEGKIDARWAAEWDRVLDGTIGEIVASIGEDSPAAADLRQTSPFAGTLSDYERRRILEAMR